MSLAYWPARRWLVATAATAVLALLSGVPTDVIPTPLFTRMTPVQWWNYPVLVAAAILGGLTVATYVATPTGTTQSGRVLGGGLLSALAVGCPVCNKLVVALLGISGALSIWAPLQPLLGIASVALLGWALRTRLAGERSCPVPAR